MTQGTAWKMKSKLKTFSMLPLLLAAVGLCAWAVYSVPAPIVDRMLEADLRKAGRHLAAGGSAAS